MGVGHQIAGSVRQNVNVAGKKFRVRGQELQVWLIGKEELHGWLIGQEKLPARLIASEELQIQLIVSEEFWAISCQGGGCSDNARFEFSLDISIYGRDMALQQCGDGCECGHHVVWFRVECGRAACTLVLVFMSI